MIVVQVRGGTFTHRLSWLTLSKSRFNPVTNKGQIIYYFKKSRNKTWMTLFPLLFLLFFDLRYKKWYIKR